ncbi:hypothetical protein SAMN04489724_3966 [Algoriphagus locisalis]|uniref:Uncharacterized protein n=1 Tax=Algoriphagus locisalis TaxID=305507 RepID=A0A1I7DEJ9_9BACT|nr:hypothetical protein [Algoriphagus locisalis]SFU10132.1 hypothetical protein SAMN04489724_3966 [Algoriphagus locisalis]
MNPKLALILTIFFLFQGLESFGQSQTFLSLYKDHLPYFQELITGAQYEDPPDNYIGHPYHKSPDFQDGVLRINGVSYTAVPLLYNENEDEVVTFHPIYQEKIRIKPGKIDEFAFEDGALFRRFSGNELYAQHKNGFYEVRSDGRIKVLVKNYKKKTVYREPGRVTYTFLETLDHFYWWDEDFVEVKNGKQAIKALGLNKKDVKKMAKLQKLDAKADLAEYMAALVTMIENTREDFKGFVN